MANQRAGSGHSYMENAILLHQRECPVLFGEAVAKNVVLRRVTKSSLLIECQQLLTGKKLVAARNGLPLHLRIITADDNKSNGYFVDLTIFSSRRYSTRKRAKYEWRNGLAKRLELATHFSGQSLTTLH